MHLLEAQSLSAGQSIGKIQIYEKYFPLPFDKYIVFAPFSKGSKNFDLYNDVLTILLPILEKEGIKIVQIGAPNERPFKGTYYIAGQTSVNQCAFIIKNSLLFFGADSFGQHLAGSYEIPLVDLVSNNYADCVRPYFGTPSKQIILEPPRKPGEKPSFSFEENPKAINRIKPEDVAKGVCKLLNLEYNFPYEQIYLGQIYISTMIESACDAVFDPKQIGVDSLIMRMDYNFNEDILIQQLQVCPCSIITNKILSDKILNGFKGTGRIKELVYEITQDNSPNFAKSVIRTGIPLRMISDLSQEQIDKLKLDYLEYGVIFKKNQFNPNNIEELKNEDRSRLYYKSSKFILSKGKVYSSKAAFLANKPISSFDDILPVIDNEVFWNELDSFRILKLNG